MEQISKLKRTSILAFFLWFFFTFSNSFFWLLAQNGTSLKERFLEMDENRDGVLTQKEFPWISLFQKMDEDQSGSINLAEVKAYYKVRKKTGRSRKKKSIDLNMKTYFDIPYRKIEGVDPNYLSLDLYSPSSSTNNPVLVMVHGGGWQEGDKSFHSMRYQKADYFVPRGYIYISINYRLSTNRSIKHPTHVKDVAAAIAWIHNNVEKYGGDPNQIFLMGHSAGAHLVSLVAVKGNYLRKHKKDLTILRGVISLDTAAYDVTRLFTELPISKRGRGLYRAAFGKNPVLWRQASPRAYVSSNKGIPPFLIFHTEERVAARVLARDFGAALQDAGISAKVVHAKDKTHRSINQDIGKAKDKTTKMILEFLKIHGVH